MADGAGEDEEVEHRVHIFRLIKGIKHGTRDIADTLDNEPDDSRRRYGGDIRLYKGASEKLFHV